MTREQADRFPITAQVISEIITENNLQVKGAALSRWFQAAFCGNKPQMVYFSSKLLQIKNMPEWAHVLLGKASPDNLRA